MALIDVERAVLSVCFKAEPPEAALSMLGDRERWLLYREMARERLLREIQFALPRSCALLGDARLEAAFVAHLDRDPPRTRYFHEIVQAFATSAQKTLEAWAGLPSHTFDLLRYEATLWEVSDLETPAMPGLVDFAFDRVPVITPALRLIELAHAVHLPDDAAGSCAPGAFRLGVQLDPKDARSRTWAFNRTSYALLVEFQRSERSAAEAVQHVASQLGRRVTPQFVERLCESLAQWIEVGIVLGSR